jgi:hypothetical protein
MENVALDESLLKQFYLVDTEVYSHSFCLQRKIIGNVILVPHYTYDADWLALSWFARHTRKKIIKI